MNISLLKRVLVHTESLSSTAEGEALLGQGLLHRTQLSPDGRAELLLPCDVDLEEVVPVAAALLLSELAYSTRVPTYEASSFQASTSPKITLMDYTQSRLGGQLDFDAETCVFDQV
jgi:hypothetical protein